MPLEPGPNAPAQPAPSLPILSLLETRVMGVLVEKEQTVPDTYPLSLNALVAGCNQKSGRDPVIEASEAEVQAALDTLQGLHLVIASSGSRVTRHAHNLGRVLRVPSQACALLATLMLRGPQTAAELRMHSERLHRFADIGSVEAFLDELAARPAGALVRKLPRAPGAREQRWMHLLGAHAPAGEIPDTQGDDAGGAAPAGDAVAAGEVAALRAQVLRLEGEVSRLREQLARVMSELGLS